MYSSHFAKIAFVTTLLVSVSLPAYAYIDPGTGSLIIQAIIGAVAAIGVTIKIFWHRLKIFFSGGSKKSEKADKQTGNDKG
jgi:uncharacterized membrane protein